MDSDTGKSAVVLDFDGSVNLVEKSVRCDLRVFEERIRYSARFSDMLALENELGSLASLHRIFFCGSGDFHHVSYPLIKLMPSKKLHLIVFDNHPDNMLLPFGIHCGSWVYHAAQLPNVASIAVFGITSQDISGTNLLQNRFGVLRSGKVKYFCLKPVSKAAAFLSGGGMIKTSSLAGSLKEYIASKDGAFYLSIDKDVLSTDSIRTSWDQGMLQEQDFFECLNLLSGRIAAADICGDLSFYRYKTLAKKILRRLDGKDAVIEDPEKERSRHHALNKKLLALLIPYLTASVR